MGFFFFLPKDQVWPLKNSLRSNECLAPLEIAIVWKCHKRTCIFI